VRKGWCADVQAGCGSPVGLGFDLDRARRAATWDKALLAWGVSLFDPGPKDAK